MGLAVGNPALILPLAFISHFAQDAIPHYDVPGKDELDVLSSRRLGIELIPQFILCVLIVAILTLSRPSHWFIAVLAAFLATSADLLWIPKFVVAQREGRLLANSNWFWRFHHWVQWKTSPKLWWVELVWFVGFGALFIVKL
jgi:hypothetical protein